MQLNDEECKNLFRRLRALEAYLWTFKEAEKEKIEIKQKLILSVYGTIHWYVQKMRKRFTTDLDDYISDASYKVLKYAIRRYNPDLGVKWSHYVSQWIMAAVLEKDRQRFLIHIPAYVQKLPEGIKVINKLAKIVSIGRVHANRNNDIDIPGKEDAFKDEKEYIEIINEALEMLRLEEKELILQRINGKTLSEIGNTRNLCRERVRQLENSALDRLAKFCKDLCQKYGVKTEVRKDRISLGNTKRSKKNAGS